MMKKFMAGMMAMATMVAGLTSTAVNASYYEETEYYYMYESFIDLRDEGQLTVTHENMKKLGVIYTNDGVNELIHAIKETRSQGTMYTQRAFVMVGYEVDGIYFYRSYTLATDDTMEHVAVTDVSMKWHSIKFEKVKDAGYDWSYCD